MYIYICMYICMQLNIDLYQNTVLVLTETPVTQCNLCYSVAAFTNYLLFGLHPLPSIVTANLLEISFARSFS